ncbi:MAG: hypothetical protein JSS75_02335 [Bacteroidetes bacterium]|nr:hypothetical protein [Bacteroidota bacterium]
MRFLAALAVLAVVIIGCESDNPNYSTFTRVLAVDSSHLGYDSSVKVIVFSPIRADVAVRIDTIASMHDSLVVYCYSHALVYDSLRYFMRKPTYTLFDTLHFYFEGVVDSLGEAPNDPALPDQFRLDSLKISLPSDRTPGILTQPK